MLLVKAEVFHLLAIHMSMYTKWLLNFVLSSEKAKIID